MADKGRPSLYTDEIGDKICETIATTNKSLVTISKEMAIPYNTIREWIRTIPHFSTNYAKAKEDQADHLAEEIIAIADDSSNDTIDGQFGPVENKEWVNRSRLRVDSRKWIASKLKPKTYGDKIDMTTGNEPIAGSGLNADQFAALLAAAKSNK